MHYSTWRLDAVEWTRGGNCSGNLGARDVQVEQIEQIGIGETLQDQVSGFWC